MKDKIKIQSEKFKLLDISITDTSQVPKGKDIFYNCKKCNSAICSVPIDNVGCDCGNIFIDIDYHRLAISDYSSFEVYEKR